MGAVVFPSHLRRALSAFRVCVGVIAALLPLSEVASAQYEPLVSHALEQGTVRVIVKLRGDFRPEGNLAGAQAALGQRQAIRALQDRLHIRMETYGPTSLKRFRRIPFVAMEVDAAGLADLMANPDVVAIEEDVPVPPLELTPDVKTKEAVYDIPDRPTLSTSTSVVGADDAW